MRINEATRYNLPVNKTVLSVRTYKNNSEPKKEVGGALYMWNDTDANIANMYAQKNVRTKKFTNIYAQKKYTWPKVVGSDLRSAIIMITMTQPQNQGSAIRIKTVIITVISIMIIIKSKSETKSIQSLVKKLSPSLDPKIYMCTQKNMTYCLKKYI